MEPPVRPSVAVQVGNSMSGTPMLLVRARTASAQVVVRMCTKPFREVDVASIEPSMVEVDL